MRYEKVFFTSQLDSFNRHFLIIRIDSKKILSLIILDMAPN